MTGRRLALLVATTTLALGVSVACEAPEAARVNGKGNGGESPLLLETRYPDLMWQSRVVPYCFVQPDTPNVSAAWEARKSEFRGALAASWGAEGVVRFVERACSDETVRVWFTALADSGGGRAGLGRAGALDPEKGVRFTERFLTEDQAGFQWLVAHEIGHVLGFEHEQDHDASACTTKRDYESEGLPLTPYDPESVMNYCASRTVLLTELDRAGFRKQYGDGTNGGSDANDAGSADGGNAEIVEAGVPPRPESTGERRSRVSDTCNPEADRNGSPAGSQPGGDRVSFRFQNRCSGRLAIAWIDYSGVAVPFGTIDPGVDVTYASYGHHKWRFRNADTGRLVADTVLPNSNSSLTIPSN